MAAPRHVSGSQTPSIGPIITTGLMTKTIRTKIRTKKGLKEYTYLGCPHTRNRSPWCFRLCIPDADGTGDCGRIAPHSLKSRIQLGIERHNQRARETHYRRLERMYLAAPCNARDDAGVRVSDGAAQIVLPIRKGHLGPAGSVHESACFRALSDAARLAVQSIEQGAVMTTVGFSIHLSRSITTGELVAQGRFLGVSEGHFLAESVLADAGGVEIGAGNGAFVKGQSRLSSGLGYG
jgi:acyl-coenzyme A thioesterase PaaI-like protein